MRGGVTQTAGGAALGSVGAPKPASARIACARSAPKRFVMSARDGRRLPLVMPPVVVGWLLLVTFGVGLVLQQLARDIFGAPAVNVIAPSWLSGGFEIFGAVVPKTRIFILVLAVACVTALAVALKASPMGRRIRAVVQNRDLAETSGISSRKTDITTFFIGSGLAGVAGVALTLIGSTSPTIGQAYLIDAFLVVVVGGLGQIKGTVIAAFGIGFLNSVIEYNTTASLAKVILFVIIVIFLQARPQGLFTVRTRSLV